MRHLRGAVPAVLVALLVVLAGCGAPAARTAGPDAAGPPQRGGSAVILQVTEPRSLDPAILTNAHAGNGVLGNALYGVLVTTDPTTGTVTYGLAQDLSSADGGTTWTLRLRDGLRFSDGSPLDAAAVKFNWDRITDPALGSASIPTARYLASTTVTDPATLTFTLTAPIANYTQSIAASSMNWIASPRTLQAGQQAVDAAPVGAGPFVLRSWTRQDRMELVRNPVYYEPERPYLDAVTLRTNTDENQRLATLTAGGGDLMISINPQLADRAEAAGFAVTRQELDGGNGLLFNTAVAPFDDPRAREAVSRAIDLNAVNEAVYAGGGAVPTTFFRDGSPFFADVPLAAHDRAGAQALFDELAAEGRPLTFTMTSYPTGESQAVVEAMQAQLSAYSNVTAHVEVLDFAGAGGKLAQRQFQAIIGGITFADPEITVWNSLHSGAPANYTGIVDPDLDAALDAGRVTTEISARHSAYATVQQRIAALDPFLLYVRTAPAVVAGEDFHGVQVYGVGSLLLDRVWTDRAS